MVIWSRTARNDLMDILYALITWKKHTPLSLSAAKTYVRDMEKAGNSICTLSYHQNVTYESHRVYGNKVYRYKRSATTMWYLIYDWDEINNVAYVNKIMSNYLTTGN